MGKINKTTQEINALLGVAGGHGADVTRLDERIDGVVALVGGHGADVTRLDARIDDLAELMTDCADAQDTDTRLKALEEAVPECVTQQDFDTSLQTLQGNVDKCVTTENFNTQMKQVSDAITHRAPAVADSDDIDAEVSAAAGTGKLHTTLALTLPARHAVFDDLWLSAVGSYGTIDYAHIDERGRYTPYMCNEVWMTYDEARACYKCYRNDWDQKEAYATNKRLARTNIPYKTQWNGNYDRFAEFNTSLEVAVIPHIEVGSLNYAFYGCVHLESATIESATTLTGVDGTFANCTSLKNLKFKGLNRSLYLVHSPLITKESLEYLCNHRAGTNDITITLHPDVYAKLTEGSGEGASAQVPWTDLLDLAESKNITFASA